MSENPRRGKEARNFTTNVPKILDLKSSSEQILSENWRWVPPDFTPHSFKKSCDKFSNNEVQTSFSLSHNNIVSLNCNFEEILTLLDDLDFHFNVVGVWNKNHNL